MQAADHAWAGLRVAVTGSSGFIGREVVERLRAVGADLVLLHRGSDRQCEWREACEHVDALIHLAAPASGVTPDGAAAAVQHTVDLFAALPERPLRVVYVSTIALFRAPDGDHVLVEDSETFGALDLDGQDLYTQMKCRLEEVVRHACADRRDTLTVLRPSNVWDLDHWSQSCVGQRFGRVWFVIAPARILRLTHVANCASAIVAALNRQDGTICLINLDDEAGISAWGYAVRTIDWRRRRYLPVPVPGWLFAGATTCAALALRVLRPRAPVPGLLIPQRRASRFGRFRIDASAARRLIGWTPDMHAYRIGVAR